MLNEYKSMIIKYKKQGSRFQGYINDIQDDINELKQSIDSTNTNCDKYLILYNNSGENDILNINTKFQFRMNHEMGVKVSKSYEVSLTDSLKLIGMEEIKN